MEKAFAFLDSNRNVLQTVQQITLRDFASRQNLEISFVGAEIVGNEQKHRLLLYYIRESKNTNFIFYTINQFKEQDQYDLDYVKLAINNGINIYFAAEKISIRNEKELDKLNRHIDIISAIKKNNALEYFLK
tara:strand:+ start:6190 stop:6585 length:396 start_codon:yes stop_codon:yes gene_type:complete